MRKHFLLILILFCTIKVTAQEISGLWQFISITNNFGDTSWCAVASTEKNDGNDDHNQLCTIGCTANNRRVANTYVPITNGRSRHAGHCDTAYSFAIVFSN